jgi:CubicO group peptidase (beta-lactamase class C family)
MLRVATATLLVFLAITGSAALERDADGSPRTFPGKTWIRHTPAEEGMDGAKVAAALDWVGRSGTETYCTVITRNGYLIGEKYWSGSNYNRTDIIWSVSKAYVATLIGTAEREKKLATTELMGKYIPEWARDPKTSGIVMDNIMRHNSGRYYDPANDFVTPQTKTDQTAFSIGLSQQFPPGTKDQYNQMAYQTLQQVYERATGQGVQAGSQKELYGPMQFESKTYWQMLGFFTGVPQKHPLVYGGVTTSCADANRFGLLWLNRGTWNTTTIFTKDFYTKAMNRTRFPYGEARQYGNWGTTDDGYRSVGLGKQIIMFNAVNGIVISRIGGVASLQFDYNEYFKMIRAAIINPELRGRDEDWVFAHGSA